VTWANGVPTGTGKTICGKARLMGIPTVWGHLHARAGPPTKTVTGCATSLPASDPRIGRPAQLPENKRQPVTKKRESARRLVSQNPPPTESADRKSRQPGCMKTLTDCGPPEWDRAGLPRSGLGAYPLKSPEDREITQSTFPGPTWVADRKRSVTTAAAQSEWATED
jgi:hypothetical protein